jgi:predicted transcriptional regulator
MRELTKAEEQVMKILWELKEGLVKDIIDKMPEPKPAYNTVSTVIRVLETKNFVDHKAYGNSYVYFPIVQEQDYKHFAFDKVMDTYFGNSYEHLVSFLVNEKKLDASEIEELTKMAEQLRDKKE